MIRHSARLILAVLLVVLAACSGNPRSGAAPSSRRELSSEELAKAGDPNAYTAVQTLRPHWLQLRGSTSFSGEGQIKVYLDGTLLGGPELLRQIATRSISSIRYLDGQEASGRFGLDHGQGAIVLRTRLDPR